MHRTRVTTWPPNSSDLSLHLDLEFDFDVDHAGDLDSPTKDSYRDPVDNTPFDIMRGLE